MRIQLHTPQAIIDYELTHSELQDFAALGHHNARRQIFNLEYGPHSDPHVKIQLLAWAVGLTDDKPQPHRP